MATNLRRTMRYGVIATGIILALFVTAQVAQLVFLASTVHTALGAIIAGGLVGIVAWLSTVKLPGCLWLERASSQPEVASGSAPPSTRFRRGCGERALTERTTVAALGRMG